MECFDVNTVDTEVPRRASGRLALLPCGIAVEPSPVLGAWLLIATYLSVFKHSRSLFRATL